RIQHARFRDLPRFLSAGDVLVINTSGTLNAALDARREDGTRLELPLSTHLPGGVWSVELRRQNKEGTVPFREGRAGEALQLPGGGVSTLLAPYGERVGSRRRDGVRLWLAALDLPETLLEFLERYGFPIRYGYA